METAGAPASPHKMGKQERLELLQRLGRLDSVDAFKTYCTENQINIIEQKSLVIEMADFCCRFDYYRDLLTYAKELDELEKLRESLLPQPTGPATVPSSDLQSAPLNFGPQTPLSAPPRTLELASEASPVQPFWLSSVGVKLLSDVWHTFVMRLALVGFIDKDQVGDMELLLGISHRGEVLTHPIRFHGFKNHAAFLFAMLYGTLRYDMPRSLTVPASILQRMECPLHDLRFEAGTYVCPNLILVPRGRGLNDDGTTRDAYWDIVARALLYDRPGRPTTDPSHSYSNALTTCRSLDPSKVAPLLVALQPLGLERDKS